MNLLTKQKQTHRLRERAYGYEGERWREEIVREFGMGMYTLLYLKWITYKVHTAIFKMDNLQGPTV